MAKFYELPMSERLQQLGEAGLDSNDMFALSSEGGLGAEQADHMIENVVGTYKLPLGIARNFVVNGREVLVPMVIEEPSVVAAASFMAKLAAKGGGFTAEADPPEMIGQMQMLDVPDPEAARERLLAAREELLAEVAGDRPGAAAPGRRPARLAGAPAAGCAQRRVPGGASGV